MIFGMWRDTRECARGNVEGEGSVMARALAVLTRMRNGEHCEWTADRRYRCPDGSWLRLDLASDELLGRSGNGWTQVTLVSDDGRVRDETGWYSTGESLSLLRRRQPMQHWPRELLALVDAQLAAMPVSTPAPAQIYQAQSSSR
jgi:hypothetical protein